MADLMKDHEYITNSNEQVGKYHYSIIIVLFLFDLKLEFQIKSIIKTQYNLVSLSLIFISGLSYGDVLKIPNHSVSLAECIFQASSDELSNYHYRHYKQHLGPFSSIFSLLPKACLNRNAK